jgi:hypothetical protein
MYRTVYYDTHDGMAAFCQIIGAHGMGNGNSMDGSEIYLLSTILQD